MGLAESDLQRFACVVMRQRGSGAGMAVERRILELTKRGQEGLASEWRAIGLIIDRLDSAAWRMKLD